MVQPDFVFRGHQCAVNSVAFFADDRFLVSGDQDGQLIVWNMLLKRQLLKKPAAHDGAILHACGFSSDTVISQGRDNKLNIWRLDASEFSGTLELRASVDIDSMNFCKFAYSICGESTWIVALEEAGAGKAYLYNLESEQTVKVSIGRKTHTTAGRREDSPMCLKLIAPSDDRFSLIVGYESAYLQVFDIVLTSPATCMARCTASVATAHKEPIMSIDYDCPKQLVYTCAADNLICCYRVDKAQLVEHCAPGKLPNPGSSEVRCFFSPALVVSQGWDYLAHLFDNDLKPICNVSFHRAALTAADMSTLGSGYEAQIADETVRNRWSSRPQWLVVASRDSRISLWSITKIMHNA
ncbi:Guanine nucleotide binding protein (G protein), beta polypeptide 1-like [Coemansia sp. Benny D115]|nr:Guanine nucleotide binding protein (G protein), beta polypeptide 1-like [Coemansia sp. Benny D115]